MREGDCQRQTSRGQPPKTLKTRLIDLAPHITLRLNIVRCTVRTENCRIRSALIDDGDYTVDETEGIHEESQGGRSGLDRVQLASGSVGRFGSGASPLVGIYFTDCMRLTQPQVHINRPATLFISRLPPHPHLRIFF